MVQRLGCKNRDALLIILGAKSEAVKAAATRDETPGPSFLTHPNNLPRREISMVGRDEEIAKILRVLAKSNQFCLVSITGVAGVGKTALALEVAHRCLKLRDLPEGLDPNELNYDAIVWTSAKQNVLIGPSFRKCSPIQSNLFAIIREMLRVVGPEKAAAMPSEDRQREIVLEQLREKHILLIVDSIEAIVDDKVLAFLQEIPLPSKVIVTDRRAVHGYFSVHLPQLSHRDAMRLIRDLCSQGIFGRRLKLKIDQIVGLANETGGIPLAIIWTLDRIGATRFDPMTSFDGLHYAESHQLSDFLFKDSYALTTENSRLVLAALHLVHAPVEGTKLAFLLGMRKDEVADAVYQLMKLSLIAEHCPSEENRKVKTKRPPIERFYRLPALIRQYVNNHGDRLTDTSALAVKNKFHVLF
jgi:LuxR family glucitol operon transcriptional activator